MQVQVRFASRRSFRNYVDISKFTDMEVEHRHDTESVISHHGDLHIDKSNYEGFRRDIDKEQASLQKTAFDSLAK